MSEWEEMLSSDGGLYYYNRKTGESTWRNPNGNAAMPWKKLKDQNGHVYYSNRITKETTWDRPDDYDDKVERAQEIEFKRKNFFRMMSSSIPKDLQLKQNPTPAPFTIKDTSARFDTDPRLICASEKERERFLDEWLLLERKRRAYLEQKQVREAMENLKQKMFEMIEAGTFTVDTKWDDVINVFRMNKDWRLLLNFDRLKVFKEVKQCVHSEFMSVAELKASVEELRRLNYAAAIEKLVEGRELLELRYDLLRAEIESLPEYMDLQQNTRGGTATDIFYDVVESRTSVFDKLGESLRDLEIPTLDSLSEHLREQNLSPQELNYVFVVYKRHHALRQHQLLLSLKSTPDLADHPPFEQALPIISQIPGFEATDDDTKRKIYGKFSSQV